MKHETVKLVIQLFLTTGVLTYRAAPAIKAGYQRQRVRWGHRRRLRRELGPVRAEDAQLGLTYRHDPVEGGYVFRYDASAQLHPRLVLQAPPLAIAVSWPDVATPISVYQLARADERHEIGRLVSGTRAQLDQGVLSGVWGESAPSLRAARDACVALVAALAALPVRDRLLERLCDPALGDGAAAEILALIAAHFPEDIPTARAALSGRGELAMLRYALARTAPSDQRASLFRAMVHDDAVAVGFRRVALKHLMLLVDPDEVRALFDLVAASAPTLVSAAIVPLFERRLAPPLESAQHALPHLPAADRPALLGAMAFGAPDPAVTRWLLGFLSGLDLLATAAVESLREVGTVAAIGPLERVAEHEQRGSLLQRACLEAIAAIRARQSHRAGGLAVVDADGGQLALVEPEGGLAVVSDGREEGAS